MEGTFIVSRKKNCCDKGLLICRIQDISEIRTVLGKEHRDFVKDGDFIGEVAGKNRAQGNIGGFHRHGGTPKGRFIVEIHEK